ncbi:hypothetical protein NE686_17300 [Tissierella carlieri]|uniref:Uncharacterized protein n=1 Tax=Tissierella carlieri TaxID=689904 RepID=A0ABT1SER0_9FIRM|nr:hypothetical protein [Tissierella carlieri]MCQ4924862.1 hypothetical protein [Tissierella carlieri]
MIKKLLKIKIVKNEKGISQIFVALLLIVLATFLGRSYFIGDGSTESTAVMPVMNNTAIEATGSISNLNDQINKGFK